MNDDLKNRLDGVKEKILKHRARYIDAVNEQVTKVMLASLDQDREAHAKAMDELETAFHILYIFDKKLATANGLEATLETLDGYDSSSGETS